MDYRAVMQPQNPTGGPVAVTAITKLTGLRQRCTP